MFHLTNKCTIQRATVTEDRYKNEKRSYSDYDKRVSCLLITVAQKAIDSISGQMITSTGYKLLLEPGQDVIAGDRVTDVIDRAGDSLAGDYDVIAVLPHNGMMTRVKTLELEKVH